MARVNHNGYIEIYMPGHHRARGNGYVFEHIIVAEGKVGRKIGKDEHVHHINGDRTDNKPDNLEVLTANEHNKITAKNRRLNNMLPCENCGKKTYKRPSEQRKNKNAFCSRGCLAKYGMKNHKKGRFNYA